MRRLEESWIEAERCHRNNNAANAIKALNKFLGMNITHSRVAEWRREVYAPSQAVLSYVLFRTLPWALERAGITVSGLQFAKLQRIFWVPGEKEGRKCAELL